MRAFFEELNEVVPPEKLALELLSCPYNDNGSTNRCVNHPIMAVMKVMNPHDLTVANHYDGVEFEVNKAIKHLLGADKKVEKVIKMDERRIVAGTTKYIIGLLSGLQKFPEGSTHLDRLCKTLSGQVGRDGNFNHRELLEAMEEFTKAGNPFKALHEELLKGGPGPKEMLSKIERLKQIYEKAIASVKMKRTMTALTFGILTIAMVIIFSLKVPLANLCIPLLMSIKATSDSREASQKAKEDEIKEKMKGAANMRKVFYSYDMLQDEQTQASIDYEEFTKFVEKVGDRIRLVLGKECEEAVKDDPSLRKELMDMVDRAERLKMKEKKIEEKMERAKSLTMEMNSDASVIDANADLARIEVPFPKGPKKNGFMKKIAKILDTRTKPFGKKK